MTAEFSVCVLAGGKGTRLRSVVSDRPKPMAPVGAKPFLEFVLDHWVEMGCAEFVLSIGYLGDCIRNYFGSEYRTVPVSYVEETEPLGTGGALLQVIRSHDFGSKKCFVVNGDTWFPVSSIDALQMLDSSGVFTLALKNWSDCSRYGSVIVDSGIVKSFEKPRAGEGLINTGCYCLDPVTLSDNFDDYPAQFSLESDFFPVAAKQRLLSGIILEHKFIDIGIPEDYYSFVRNYVD